MEELLSLFEDCINSEKDLTLQFKKELDIRGLNILDFLNLYLDKNPEEEELIISQIEIIFWRKEKRKTIFYF